MDALAKKLTEDKIYNQLVGGFIIAEEERNIALSHARISFVKRDRAAWLSFCEIYYNASKNLVERVKAIDFYATVLWEALDDDSRTASEGATEDQGRAAP